MNEVLAFLPIFCIELFSLFFYAFLQDSWRVTCAKAVMLGIPTPAITSALAFFDGYRQESLPSNLIQVNDFFIKNIVTSNLN